MIKAIVFLVVALGIAAVAANISKPSDSKCIELMKSKVAEKIAQDKGNDTLTYFLNYFAGKSNDEVKHIFTITNHTFSKEVYIDDVKIGSASLGSFTLEDNIAGKLATVALPVEQNEDNSLSARAQKVKAFLKGHVDNVANIAETVNTQLKEEYKKLELLKNVTTATADSMRATINENIQVLKDAKKELEGTHQ